MYLPVVRKMIFSNDALVERALPCTGVLNVKVGDKVEAFTELGTAKVSRRSFLVDPAIKFVSGKSVGSNFSEGEIIGRLGLKSIKAPFNGTLVRVEKGLVLQEVEWDYLLLSGVWGRVTDVVENASVVVKTQIVDIHMLVCTTQSVQGELVVFPNLSGTSQVKQLEKHAKSASSKIFYVGDFVDVDFVKKACALKVSGILAGSAHREAFILAKRKDTFLGAFNGFGTLHTPDEVFDTLSSVAGRFVFVCGENNALRIPMPEKFSAAQVRKGRYKGLLKKANKGTRVVVLDEKYFNWVGTIEKILESRIVVKLERNGEVVEMPVPNVLILG